MAMPYIETPRTEHVDHTRMSIGDLDNLTENSIPSPSKDGNDLIKQMKAMRAGNALQTPRGNRAPFNNRRNVQKNEFTPLLKSAATNRFKMTMYNQENTPLATPKGLKAGYVMDSPALPLNSSMMREEYTGSPMGPDDGSATPQAPAPSSSVLSTPVALHARGGDGPLENRGNLATLREQELKLEQIDKENFGLKLKIHFLEEQMKRSGKDFTATAIKENTELKVDKITLQTDLKKNRKALEKAQQDLEEYKKQFADYTEKVKRRHMNDDTKEELDQLKREAAEKDAKIQSLEQSTVSRTTLDEQVGKLQDDIGDLEAELREKDRELDEKDDEIEKLHEKGDADKGLQQALKEKDEEVAELRKELSDFKDGVESAAKEQQLKLQARDAKLADKADQLEDLQVKLAKNEDAANNVVVLRQRLESVESEYNTQLRQKTRTIEELESEVQSARQRLDDEDHKYNTQLRQKTQLIEELQSDVQSARRARDEVEEQYRQQLRQKTKSIEELEAEIHTSRRKLQEADGRDVDAEKLHDEISGLKSDVREKERAIEEIEDEFAALEDRLRDEHDKAESNIRQAENDLRQADARIKDLESQQTRQLRELQTLRDNGSTTTNTQQKALEEANTQINDLQDELDQREDLERQLQEKLKTSEARIQEADETLKQEQREHEQHEQRLQDTIADLEDEIKELNDKLIAIGKTNDVEGALQVELETLRKDLQDAKAAHNTLRTDHDLAQSQWNSQRRALESQKTKAEDQAASLQRTIDLLQANEGDLSGREANLRKALASEKQHHAEEKAELQAELDELTEASAEQLRQLSNTKAELSSVRRKLQDSQDEIVVLEDKIQALEDEVEVLQTSMDEDIDHLKHELSAAQKARTDLKAELESTKVTSNGSPTPATTPIPQRELRQEVMKLREQVSTLKKERQDFQRQLHRAESAASDALAEYDTLQFDLRASTGTKGQLQQKMHDLRDQVHKAREEKQKLEDLLADKQLDLDTLRMTLTDLESSRDTAQQQLRQAKTDLANAKRDHDRKLATNEEDIANLERELADAISKQESLTRASTTAEQQITRLQTKVKNLETQLDSTRNKTSDHDTSAEERHDLHEMLKDAKLEAEDLALQIRQRDARMSKASHAESELRGQLKRLREQRANEASELITLQASHDRLAAELLQLHTSQQQQSSLRHKSKSGVDKAADHDAALALSQLTRRHKGEQRYLVAHVEYLSARLAREARFRSDLGYVKQFFTKQVEMYGKCTAADLRLVKAMGIPVEEVGAGQEELGVLEGRGGMVLRRAEGGGWVPSLRTVGLMVCAGLRMRRRGERWAEVKRGHEGLVRKLEERKRGVGKV